MRIARTFASRIGYQALILAGYLLLFSFASMATSGCTKVSVDQGQEAVLIDKPIFFGHGGLRDEPVKPGLSFTWFSTWATLVDMYPRQRDLQINDLMSSDGVPLDFHAVVRMQVTDSVDLIRRFGPEWYERNVQQQMLNLIRTAVKKHGMNETAIDTTAVEDIDREVSAGIVAYLEDNAVPVQLLNFTVGRANPPDAILTQRVATAAEQQRINTEAQRKLAEDGRKAAEASRAEADNAYRLSMSLSPEQFVELERIKMMRDSCASGGCTFIAGASPAVLVGK